MSRKNEEKKEAAQTAAECVLSAVEKGKLRVTASGWGGDTKFAT
jgi:hypothetical protein